MKHMFYILVILGLAGTHSSGAQGLKCSSVISSSTNRQPELNPRHGDLHQAPDLLLPFKWDYIPLFRTIHLQRRLDANDELLMRMSYSNNGGTMNNPVEFGIVELIGKSGQILGSKIIPGTYRQVRGMGSVTLELLAQNKDRISDVAIVRERHTHPQDNRLSIMDYAFSDADMASGFHTRKIMDALGYSKIRLESWIIFMSDYDFTYVSDVKNKKISTRGYIVPRKKLVTD